MSDANRARFWALTAEIEAIEAVSGPLRAARDAFVQEARERERVLSDEINAAEAGLFDMKQDLAFLARGLRGVVGERVG